MKNLTMNVTKRIMAFLMMAVIVMGAAAPAMADTPENVEAKHIVLTLGDATMQRDDQEVEIDGAVPVYNNGRVYVPLRAVAEAFGADVEYVPSNMDVIIKNDNIEIVMNIDSSLYTVNGELKTMDMAPYANDGCRTMVPVRFISEAFGYDIEAITNDEGKIDRVEITRPAE